MVNEACQGFASWRKAPLHAPKVRFMRRKPRFINNLALTGEALLRLVLHSLGEGGRAPQYEATFASLRYEALPSSLRYDVTSGIRLV